MGHEREAPATTKLEGGAAKDVVHATTRISSHQNSSAVAAVITWCLLQVSRQLPQLVVAARLLPN
eukprot:6058171-Prymnesium_polylepis.1